MKKNIISIQSQVASGFVGNTVASLAIQRQGINVLAVPTVLLSTHTDQAIFYGEDISTSLFQMLLKGIESIPVYAHIQCIISGYINHVDIINLTSDWINTWKHHHPNGLYIYDPVFGDIRTHGLYIKKEVAAKSEAQLLPICDILTPNHFELEYLTKSRIHTKSDLKNQVSDHPILSQKDIILTSASLSDLPSDRIETIWIHQGIIERFRTPKIPVDTVGTGDLFTAILSAQISLNHPISQAIEQAMSFTSQVLKILYKTGEKEMNACALMQADINKTL